MSRVYTDTLEPRKPTQDITLGTTGETITLPGNDLRVNTVKDKGGNTLWTSDGSGTLSSVNAAFVGNLKLLTSTTAAADSEIVFSNTYINSTYDLYLFKLINMHPSANTNNFKFWGSENNGGAYNVNKTVTYMHTRSDQGSTVSGPTVDSTFSQYNTTTEQTLGYSVGDQNYEAITGELWLFSPAPSTFVTHFCTTMNYMKADNDNSTVQIAGYFGTYSAASVGTSIDAIKFTFASGNIDSGTIKLYGLSG